MPAQLNYIDGFIVDDVVRFAAGDGLYPDPTVPPYTVTVYTPGFMVAMAGLMQIGLDGFAAGRLMVLGSMLLL